MRIAFICSGLEIGKDGVGDYARGLAIEVQGMGHEVAVIALNDANATCDAEEQQPGVGGAVNVLRLRPSTRWSDRVKRMEAALESFQPDWISFQFVCYGFHPKGMVHGLGRRVSPFIRSRRLHLMFHELWIGEERTASWKRRTIGVLQRLFVEGLVRRLEPRIVHTSNQAYRALLFARGFRAELLPMFGSVPILQSGDFAWIDRQLANSIGPHRRDKLLVFGMFGALHPTWPPEPLMHRIGAAISISQKRGVIASIGRMGQGEILWDKLKQEYGNRFAFVRFGEQSAGRISDFLRFIDIGIATTPRQLVGKSSTVAAMLEHGIPVIVNRDDAEFRVIFEQDEEPLIVPCDEHLESRIVNGIERASPCSRRQLAARQLIEALQVGSGRGNVTETSSV